jgi:hypothetical protein
LPSTWLELPCPSRDSACFGLLSKFKVNYFPNSKRPPPCLILPFPLYNLPITSKNLLVDGSPEQLAHRPLLFWHPGFKVKSRNELGGNPWAPWPISWRAFAFSCFLPRLTSVLPTFGKYFLATGGPACLLFVLLSLMIHFIISTGVVGSLLLLFARGGGKQQYPGIASNATIGGPATVAAFCQGMRKGNPAKLKGRTIAATVWGVVCRLPRDWNHMLGVGMYKVVGGSII